jgi:hypothetical protein
VRNFTQFAFTVRTYLLFVLIAGVIALPETFLGTKLIPGFGTPVSTLETGRLGLYRAPSGFDHPILYGAFCAASLGLIWYLYQDRPVRWMIAACVVGATFLGLSSAPLLACIVTAIFILWEQYTRSVQNRAAITISIFVIGYLVLSAVTNRSPIELILPYISLDAWTAYYRVLIWHYAMMNISDNPIFGLGLTEWVRPSWMPTSVDCLWLTLMLLGGIPTLGLLVTGIVLLMRRVHGQPQAESETRQTWQARFGWTATVLALCFQAFTVHYWGAMHAVFFFVLGLGAWLTDSSVAEHARSSVAPSNRSRAMVVRPRVLVTRSAKALVGRNAG